MFCNQSDYEFLHNLIQTAPNADEGKTSQKELFRYLVNKTGGKLYKYRFFDENGYSISNLETDNFSTFRWTSAPYCCALHVTKS